MPSIKVSLEHRRVTVMVRRLQAIHSCHQLGGSRRESLIFNSVSVTGIPVISAQMQLASCICADITHLRRSPAVVTAPVSQEYGDPAGGSRCGWVDDSGS